MRDSFNTGTSGSPDRSPFSLFFRFGGLLLTGIVACLAGWFAMNQAVAHNFDHVTGTFDEFDPARGVPLPCEAISTVGSSSRAARNLVHMANFCGLVGTDMEFQSRTDSDGNPRHYAFMGSMGYGFRIIEITDFTADSTALVPVLRFAGGYSDAGWQNDIQIRGDIAISTFDGVVGEDSTASLCLKTNYPDADGQGVDIFTLNYDPVTGNFNVQNPSCVANPPGGAHNSTLHPSGNWLAISNSSSDWAMDLIDITDIDNPVHKYRFIEQQRDNAARCPQSGATFSCVHVKNAQGDNPGNNERFQPHDLQFSGDGNLMFVAAIKSTYIMDVSDAFNGNISTIATIPNQDPDPNSDPSADIQISHQSDITPDGKILIVTDEAGGGLNNADCNTQSDGIIGSMHFYALAPLTGVPASAGASMANPVKLGFYLNPNPNLQQDQLQDEVQQLPRAERACTVHVFRIGGNGSSSPGEAQAGFGGVSSLSNRQLITSWYGGGVWQVDFSGPPDTDPLDPIAEDSRSTWGNTLAYSVMPGAETWSAKEYKGVIATGDMTRGMDLFRISPCGSGGILDDNPLCLPLLVENKAPVAVDDQANDQNGQAVVVPVLDNDTDENFDELRVAQFTQGTHGVVTDNLDGTLTYTHGGSSAVSDTFTYTIDDGRGGNDTATVTITLPDADEDGLNDGADNCPAVANATQADSDTDGVGDVCDNCLNKANSDQCNTNAPDADEGDLGDDQFGNACDADLDNNGIVNSFDLTIMRNNFGAAGQNDADLTCDDIVNSFDLSKMRDDFGQAPGPTGIAP